MEPETSTSNGPVTDALGALSLRMETAMRNKVSGRLKDEDLAEIHAAVEDLKAEKSMHLQRIATLENAQKVAEWFIKG